MNRTTNEGEGGYAVLLVLSVREVHTVPEHFTYFGTFLKVILFFSVSIGNKSLFKEMVMLLLCWCGNVVRRLDQRFSTQN